MREHYKNKPRERERDENSPNLGSDYHTLQPSQQAGRQKTQASWTKKKNLSFLCLRCQTSFPYDKSIENYLEARNKALEELNAHKRLCSANNLLQPWWEEVRKSRRRIIKTCVKCWGKVIWDKSIADIEEAKQQALSDLKYHQEHESHLTSSQRTIAIYHSPNQGGNQHALIDNSLRDDGIYLQDEEGEQMQVTNGFNWKHPGVIGGGIALMVVIIGAIVYFATRNKKYDKS